MAQMRVWLQLHKTILITRTFRNKPEVISHLLGGKYFDIIFTFILLMDTQGCWLALILLKVIAFTILSGNKWVSIKKAIFHFELNNQLFFFKSRVLDKCFFLR